MSLNVSELHAVLDDLFGGTADRLARDTGFCLRRRKLSGPDFAKALVFCLIEKPAPSLEDFADFACEHLGARVSYKAFEERFSPRCVDFLASLLGEALGRCFTARANALPLLRRFNGVFLRDASLVGLPACLADVFPARASGPGAAATAALKVVLEVEVSTGQFTELEVQPALDNDKTSPVAAKPLPEGSLLLEDMGFLCGDRLRGYEDQGVYFLTRVPHWTAFFVKGRARGYERLDLARWLRRAGGWCLSRDAYVFHEKKLKLRVLAVRVPPEVAERRRGEARRDARKRGRPVSEGKLELCEWNILVTNAPRELISAYEGWELRRVRWQIEVVFKVFKSGGGLGKTRARSAERVLSELYAKLLAQVVQRWVQLAAGYVALRHSAIRTAKKVRERAESLLRALGSEEALGRQVDGLSHQFTKCKIQKRHRRLSTFDRLAALDAEFRQLDLAA